MSVRFHRGFTCENASGEGPDREVFVRANAGLRKVIRLCKKMECIQKSLWTQFQTRMNPHSGAAILSSIEIFQHALSHDKIIKRGKAIDL